MKHILLIIVFTATGFFTIAQRTPKIKTVDELINYADPGWKNVKKMIDSAVNKVDIMAVDTNAAREAIYQLQVEANPNSPLGGIVYSTGGLLVEGGWLRVLGSGSNKLTRSVSAWNKGKTFDNPGETGPYLLIADDALGGFFAINNGGLGSDRGRVYYLCPWTLQWDRLDMSYTDFLRFCFEGDFEEFYKPYMSKNWKYDVATLTADKCYNYTPPLWSKEGQKFTKSVRKHIPIEEQYNLNMQMRKQFGFDKDEE